MEREEALRLVAKVKANWYRQPVDEVVVAEWAERLAPMEYRHACAAICEFADSARSDPPTPGQVLAAARDIAKRELDERRRRVRVLEEPPPSAEEQRRVKELIGGLFKERGWVREAAVHEKTSAAAARPAGPIDAETQRAQAIVLTRRRELGIEAAK